MANSRPQMLRNLYNNGPIKDQERKCTDVFCCIIFAIFIISMLGVGIYCWTSSSFTKLITPYDAQAKACGVDYPDHPYIYFVAPQINTFWRTVCVKTCPQSQQQQQLDCAPNKYIKSCSKLQSANSQQAVRIYATTQFKNTMCLPTSNIMYQKIIDAIGQNNIQSKVFTLQKVWPIILASIPITIVVSIIFMLFIRLTAGFFIYLILLIATAALIGFGTYIIIQPSKLSLNTTFANIIGGISIGLGALLVILLLCFHKKLSLAATIMKVSARFVQEQFVLVITPFVLFVLLTAFITLWIVQALGIFSMGRFLGEQKLQPFSQFQSTPFVKGLMVVHIFQLFWGVFFVVQLGSFIINGTATSWYFQRQSPFCQSLNRLKNFHIGTVAMGSFFLALIGFIKFMYQLLVPQKQQQQGTCMYQWKKFCGCCCYICVTKLFECFNSGAYTYTHLAGQSYCEGALKIAALKLQNLSSSALITTFGAVFTLIMRLAIVGLTILASYLILTNVQPYKSQLQNITMPMVLIGFIALAVGSLFVSLYSSAIQAIYNCFILDKDAGGGQDKAPKELLQFLNQQ